MTEKVKLALNEKLKTDISRNGNADAINSFSTLEIQRLSVQICSTTTAAS